MKVSRNVTTGNSRIENSVKFDERHKYNPGRPITLAEQIAAYEHKSVRK